MQQKNRTHSSVGVSDTRPGHREVPGDASNYADGGGRNKKGTREANEAGERDERR